MAILNVRIIMVCGTIWNLPFQIGTFQNGHFSLACFENKTKNLTYKMVQANHHSKSECLATDQPFQNGTILNQSVKMFGIGMTLGFPSSVWAPAVWGLLVRGSGLKNRDPTMAQFFNATLALKFKWQENKTVVQSISKITQELVLKRVM